MLSRRNYSAFFAFLLVFSAALAIGLPAPAEARDPSGVTWPKDGMFLNPLVIMTTAAASGDDMQDYTDVILYVLMPGAKGVPLRDPNTQSNTINPAAVTLKAQMHYRGQATGSNPKHQFDVKLKDDWPAKTGTGNFMNMDKGGKHWVFNAPGKEVQDATMIRNVMAFDMQRTLGVNTGSNAWAPRTKYFEFFAVYNYSGSDLPSLAEAQNGYLGVYINFEHIRADPQNRVPIPETYAPKNDNAVGGVIVQVNPPYLPGTTPIPPAKRQVLMDSNLAGNSSPVLLEWPELDFFNDTAISASKQQQRAQWLTNIENWFYNPDQGGDFLGWAYLFTNNCTTGPPSGANSGKGFLPQPSTCPGCTDTASYWTLVEKYTDLQSFAEYLLLNELAKDPDGYHKSTFMYRLADTLDKDSKLVPGRIFGGPLWDKNKSYYGYGDPFNNPDGWLFTVANCGQAPYWWQVFSQYDGFQTLVTAAWQNSYNTKDGNGAFDYSRIASFVQDQVNTLMGPAPASKDDPPNGPFTRDQQVWFSTDPTAAQTQLQADVNTMLGFIQSRLIWMNANLPNLGQAISTDCQQY